MLRLTATTLVLASLAVVPFGCEQKPAAPAVETVKLGAPVEMSIPVKGMHCEGCEGAICGKVEKIEGVTAVKASHVDEAHRWAAKVHVHVRLVRLHLEARAIGVDIVLQHAVFAVGQDHEHDRQFVVCCSP